MPLFTDAQLDKIIKDTLPQLPPDRKSAVVMQVDDKGVGVVGHFVKDTATNTWDVEMAVKRGWDGDISAGVKVIWSFS